MAKTTNRFGLLNTRIVLLKTKAKAVDLKVVLGDKELKINIPENADAGMEPLQFQALEHQGDVFISIPALSYLFKVKGDELEPVPVAGIDASYKALLKAYPDARKSKTLEPDEDWDEEERKALELLKAKGRL